MGYSRHIQCQYVRRFYCGDLRIFTSPFSGSFSHYPAEQIAVVPLASSFADYKITGKPEKLGDLNPGQFWLNVATVEPRKNPRRLAQAYARLKANIGVTFPLVLAGGRGWLMEIWKITWSSLGFARMFIS